MNLLIEQSWDKESELNVMLIINEILFVKNVLIHLLSRYKCKKIKNCLNEYSLFNSYTIEIH